MQQSDSLPLKGRVALVTGASRGIGAAIALRLVRAGACVAINYVSDDERAERCAQHIMNDCGAAGRVITCKADVTDYGQVRDMVSTVVTTFGGLDILVNNAFARYSFDPRNRKTLHDTARRMPQGRIQHLQSCAAADAASGRRTRHQHLQQSRRLPDRAVS